MVIIPACGEGRRFREAGYTEPKHLIPLGGKPMIDWVEANVTILDSGEIARVVRRPSQGERVDSFFVGDTKGAIDTILKVAQAIPEHEPLVVANCDQLLKFPENLEMHGDGIVFTFRSNNSAHSYVVTDGDFILDIVEKPENPPSDRAVSGVYWFREAGDFLEACREVTQQIEGEQYISSALSQMLGWGYNLYAVDAPTAILGTPEDFSRMEVALELARAS